MPRRSKVETLPRDFREMLERLIAENNFARYEAVAGEMNRLLKSAGVQVSVSKSGAQRYGQNLARKLSAIKASTEAARLIAEQAPDDADARSGAVLSLIQTEIFETLVNLQELDDPELDQVARAKLLSTLAKNVATLSRASVHHKRHELEIRAKVEAAAERIAKRAKQGGASRETVDEIRREVLGIAA